MLKVQIIGNLGADAKVNRGTYGEFVSFNVAHTEKFTDKNGQQIEATSWINCTINWNCGRILPYLRKGTKIFCYGHLKTRIFTGHDGNSHVGLDCVVSDLELCGSALPSTAIAPSAPLTVPKAYQPDPQQNAKVKKANKSTKLFENGKDPFEEAAHDM